MKQHALAVATIALAVACSDAPSPTVATLDQVTYAPVAAREPEFIPGRFIVTLREGANPAGIAREHGVAPDFVYTHALTGFAGRISDAARAGLLRDARVVRVEQDGIAHKSAIQANATWGLDRIDQRGLPLSKGFAYTSTGVGVTAYILDTGIRTGHAEFAGRASGGYTAIADGRGAEDCDGHGTHVAGTVGGTTYGVAKGVTLVAVRVLDCAGSGSWSGIIAGMDWVAANHRKPAVANMSLGGGASSSVDAALQRMIAAGVSTAVAAGNGNRGGRQQDACGYSPARVPEAITIGATTQTDAKTSWSNYGACVDFFAPGYQITSAGITSNTATATMSGTSMASPHVAGVAALYLAGNPGATPPQVSSALAAATTKGVVTSSSTANNHLLYTAY
ncbi:MAG TPA: S8 family serine peptidase [Gemmatimonadaceae bacterium]|nr:S8 family serine peptidase [Gemmatimonadaceae bacterium]